MNEPPGPRRAGADVSDDEDEGLDDLVRPPAALQAQARSLRIVQSVADAVYHSLDLDDVVRGALEAISRNTQSISIAIFTLNEAAGRVELLGARGFSESVLRVARSFPLEGSLTGVAVRSKRVVTSKDIARDRRIDAEAKRVLLAEGYNMTVSVPLLAHDRVIGAMNLIYRSVDDMPEPERIALVSVGKTIGPAMANAAHVRRLEEEMAERRRTEAELQRFKYAVDHTGEEFYLLHVDGVVSYVNEAAAKSLGYPVESLVGMRIDTFCPSMQPSAFRAHVDALRKRSIGPFEATHITHAGDRRLKEISSAYVLFGDEPLVCMFASDVTERRRLERTRAVLQKQVRTAERVRSLSLLAGGIAHDFNNLLTGILGNVSLAKMRIGEDPKAIPLLQEAEKAAKRAKGLTQQLLTFSKGGTLTRGSHDLHELVRDAAEFVLRGSAVACELDLPDRLWPADIDADQIAQVVQNLAINAKDAMPEGGVLRISARNVVSDGQDGAVRGDFVELVLEDEGVGIPESDLQHIFDPFFTTKESGSGLGLATSYSIIQQHGGAVFVTSEAGRGTRFRILLPAARGASDTPPTRESKLVRGTGRILVMDDEQMVRDLLRSMLGSLGFEVETVEDGEDALDDYESAFRAGAFFDLVILDLTVPGGMGGLETMRRLREIDPDVVAVVSTGYANDPITSSYSDHGFRDVLVKPYHVEDISRILEQIRLPAEVASEAS